MNLYDKLQGWKQTIALLYWIITMPLIPMWFPDDPLAGKISTTVGIVLSGLGIGSSVAKKYQVKITKELEDSIKE
jgi:hypothetical protein